MLPKTATEAWREICQATDANELLLVFEKWKEAEKSQTSHITNSIIENIGKMLDEIKGFIKGKEEARMLDFDYQQRLFSIKMELLRMVRIEYDISGANGAFPEWLEMGKILKSPPPAGN